MSVYVRERDRQKESDNNRVKKRDRTAQSDRRVKDKISWNNELYRSVGDRRKTVRRFRESLVSENKTKKWGGGGGGGGWRDD